MLAKRDAFRTTAVIYPLLSLGLFVGVIGVSTPVTAATGCSVSALSTLGVPEMTITGAVEVPAGGGAPAFCRVNGNVATDGDGAGPNQAGFQISLPASWNGKFLFLGGGGFDGNSAMHDGPPQYLAKGYATSTTNSGHTEIIATFAIKSPGVPDEPKLIDYFYRSRHQVGIASKQLIRAFYNTAKIKYSYFLGCSNGGRQALMEASRYPDDYDGIIAGAPWMEPLGTELLSLKGVRALLAAYIPYSLFPKINAAILAQCDAADGVSDGLIQNPARCAFCPDSLVPSVLTQPQSDAIKTIIAPVTDSSGRFIYPGRSVTSLFDPDESPFNSISADEGATPPSDPTAPIGLTTPGAGLVYGVIDYMALYNPNYNLNSDAFERRGVVSTGLERLMYSNMRLDLADDPALIARYLEKGKKLIIYHGYSDAIISSYRTVLFYESLAHISGGHRRLQQGARLFMVPGMGHCGSSSTAPDVFGAGVFITPLPPGYPIDAQHDVLSALEGWVENGNAPASIIATHYAGDNSTTGTVDRTMPLCPFPAEAHYRGSGNVNDAASWTCTENTKLLETGPNGREAGVYGPEDQPRFPPDVVQ
jgi:feruloyl esterase